MKILKLIGLILLFGYNINHLPFGLTIFIIFILLCMIVWNLIKKLPDSKEYITAKTKDNNPE